MNQSLKSPRGLAFLGLMLAITIILDVSPLGAIPVGTISATITHIPTIITGIILGPIPGLIMGTSLGLISMLHALMRPMTIFDPLFINPLISVLPRMFIGVVAYYVFAGISKLLKKNFVKNTVNTFISGFAGSFTNTALVFLMLYLVYAKEVAEKAGAPFHIILFAVFTTNAIAEGIIAGIITMAVAAAWFRYQKTRKPI